MIRREDIRPALASALQAEPTFAASGILAIIDDGSKQRTEAMESELAERGVVIAIAPLLGSELAGSEAASSLERIVVRIDWRENPTRNFASTGAALLHDRAVGAIIALLAGLGAPGAALEGMEPGNEGTLTKLVDDDPGLVTTAVFATVPVLLQP